MPPKRSNTKVVSGPKKGVVVSVAKAHEKGNNSSKTEDKIILPMKPTFQISHNVYQIQLKSGKEHNLNNKLFNAYDSSKYNEALEICDKLLAAQPFNCDFVAMRGAILFHLKIDGNTETGLPGPDNILTDENRNRVAHAWLDRSIDLHGWTQCNNHFVYHIYGLISKEERDYELTYKLYEKAIQLSNYNPSMIHYFATSAICLGKYKEAIKAYEVFMERGYTDDYDKAIYSLILSYYIIGNYKQTIVYCDKAIEEKKSPENIKARKSSSNFSGAFNEYEKHEFDYNLMHIYIMRNFAIEKNDGKKQAIADIETFKTTEFIDNVNDVIGINKRLTELTCGISGEENRKVFINAINNLIEYAPEDVYSIDMINRELLKSSKTLIPLPFKTTVNDITAMIKTNPTYEKIAIVTQNTASHCRKVVIEEHIYIWGVYTLLIKALIKDSQCLPEEIIKKITNGIEILSNTIDKINSKEPKLQNDYEKIYAQWIQNPSINGKSVLYEMQLIIAIGVLNNEIYKGNELKENYLKDIKTNILLPYINQYGIKREVLAFSESLKHLIDMYSEKSVAEAVYKEVNEIAEENKETLFSIKWFGLFKDSDKTKLIEILDKMILKTTENKDEKKISLLPEYTMTKCELMQAFGDKETKKEALKLAKTIPAMEVGDRYLSTFLYKIAYANDDHESALEAYQLFQPKYDALLQSQEYQDFVFMTEALKSYIRKIKEGDMEYVFRAMKMCYEILCSGAEECSIMHDFVGYYLKKLSTLPSFLKGVDLTLNKAIETRTEVQFAAVIAVALADFIKKSDKFKEFYENKEKYEQLKEKLNTEYSKHFELQLKGDKADNLVGAERIREYDHFCLDIINNIYKSNENEKLINVLKKAYPNKMYKCMMNTIETNSKPTNPYFILNPYIIAANHIIENTEYTINKEILEEQDMDLFNKALSDHGLLN